MTATTEKQLTKAAEVKGYRLEKVGKGPHHGRFALVHKSQGSRVRSEIPGADFTFSIEEAQAWLAKK
jgi:hypothetical protein